VSDSVVVSQSRWRLGGTMVKFIMGLIGLAAWCFFLAHLATLAVTASNLAWGLVGLVSLGAGARWLAEAGLQLRLLRSARVGPDGISLRSGTRFSWDEVVDVSRLHFVPGFTTIPSSEPGGVELVCASQDRIVVVKVRRQSPAFSRVLDLVKTHLPAGRVRDPAVRSLLGREDENAGNGRLPRRARLTHPSDQFGGGGGAWLVFAFLAVGHADESWPGPTLSRVVLVVMGILLVWSLARRGTHLWTTTTVEEIRERRLFGVVSTRLPDLTRVSVTEDPLHATVSVAVTVTGQGPARLWDWPKRDVLAGQLLFLDEWVAQRPELVQDDATRAYFEARGVLLPG
jgi:hypothetical protein